MTFPNPLQVITIPLAGMVNDKIARLARGPQVMRRTDNTSHALQGELGKRRGFTRITTTGSVGGQQPDGVLVAVGDNKGELVVIGRNNIYSIGTPDETVSTGEALIHRGPSMSGNFSLGTIHVSPVSND